ncbi:protein of unknown function [Pseudorhizobium banfieldiae]|uniref:Uncharacterized protein n=1 Tax=Pseudorhizobium banfieldiae TaxID=1125847 RepID=L0NI86_9HYPH|nr:protein of unknown function [Pseudorhizobium banfieldiae]
MTGIDYLSPDVLIIILEHLSSEPALFPLRTGFNVRTLNALTAEQGGWRGGAVPLTILRTAATVRKLKPHLRYPAASTSDP